jgi:hypothetical protein
MPACGRHSPTSLAPGASALQLENARLREELDRLKRRLTRGDSTVSGAAPPSQAAAGQPPDAGLLQEAAKVGGVAVGGRAAFRARAGRGRCGCGSLALDAEGCPHRWDPKSLAAACAPNARARRPRPKSPCSFAWKTHGCDPRARRRAPQGRPRRARRRPPTRRGRCSGSCGTLLRPPSWTWSGSFRRGRPARRRGVQQGACSVVQRPLPDGTAGCLRRISPPARPALLRCNPAAASSAGPPLRPRLGAQNAETRAAAAEEQLDQLQSYLARASVAYQREIVRLRQALAGPAGAPPGGAGPGPGADAAAALQLPPLAR